ncbi:MAG: hypothetical protein KKH94_12665 [Candidatus Omnitrophica bacterium]|nr:hypothetical protein [Candidatus Omnitrophota bacterium]
MKMNKKLCIGIFAWGDYLMGMGHVYRQLRLFEHVNQRGCDITFYTFRNSTVEKLLRGKIAYQCVHSIYDIDPKRRFTHFVFDVLNVPLEDVKYIRNKTDMIVSFDNNGKSLNRCDVSFNCLYPNSRKNVVSDYEYLILPDECLIYQKKKKLSKIKKILVMQGGTDTYGVLLRLARVLPQYFPHLQFTFITGSLCIYKNELIKIIQAQSNVNVEFDISSLHKFAACHDVAITGGGMGMFEIAAMGIPVIACTQELKELKTMMTAHKKKIIITMGLTSTLTDTQLIKSVQRSVSNIPNLNQLSSRAKEKLNCNGIKKILRRVGILDECTIEDSKSGRRAKNSLYLPKS